MTLTLAAWLHTLSPFLVRFTDEFGIRWYGLSYLLGFLAGWAWLRYLARRGLTPLSEQRVGDAMVALVLGVVLGGRLGYCLFYQPSLLTELSGDFPFWGVLRLTQGGMSSHGGMLGVAVAAWWISRGVRDAQGQVRFRAPLLHVFDLVALAATPGLLFGRLANFINGELLGKIVANPESPPPPGP
jgi:phosphatidylglycerol:prolipoprotein diacylglycerol transferase